MAALASVMVSTIFHSGSVGGAYPPSIEIADRAELQPKGITVGSSTNCLKVPQLAANGLLGASRDLITASNEMRPRTHLGGELEHEFPGE